MPDITGTQSNGTVTVSSPSSPDLTAELARVKQELEVAQRDAAKAQRSYEGLDGNFKTVKTERDTLENQLRQLTAQAELEKKSITSENETLKTTMTEKEQALAQLQTTHSTTEEQFQALQLVMREYPDLVQPYSKGLVRIDGLKGEDLKNYLETWKTSLGDMVVSTNQQKNSGTVPKPPNQQMDTVTLSEATDRKLDALRTKGPNSEEYQRWSQAEAELIRQRAK